MGRIHMGSAGDNGIGSLIFPFFTRELRACARASYRYDVGNGTRSLDWSIPVNFFRF